MSKTKYIKVSVSDRLPDKTGIYSIEFKNQLIRSWFNGLNFFRNGEIITAEYWLQEVPDYEDEMKEMLESIYETLGQIWQIDDKNKIFEFIDPVEIEELLTKLKTES